MTVESHGSKTGYTYHPEVFGVKVGREKPYDGNPIKGRDGDREVSDPYEMTPLKNVNFKQPLTVATSTVRGVELISDGVIQSAPDTFAVRSRRLPMTRVFTRQRNDVVPESGQ